jgi:hypothetical protein
MTHPFSLGKFLFTLLIGLIFLPCYTVMGMESQQSGHMNTLPQITPSPVTEIQVFEQLTYLKSVWAMLNAISLMMNILEVSETNVKVLLQPDEAVQTPQMIACF